jgi:hypothetical protein
MMRAGSQEKSSSRTVATSKTPSEEQHHERLHGKHWTYRY